MVLPIFKSHYSVGKSILTLEPAGSESEGGADSVFTIAKELGLKEVVLVEDSMTGLPTAIKNAAAANLQLIFGINVSVCNDYESAETSTSKVCLLAKNSDGLNKLKEIFTFINVDRDGLISNEDLELFPATDIALCVPFYDSFIWNNFHSFSTCLPDFLGNAEALFVEENHLPFDAAVAAYVHKFNKSHGIPVWETKSIYYKNRCDFEAWVTYKLACSRSMGKQLSLSAPELEGCGSDEFCAEALTQ